MTSRAFIPPCNGKFCRSHLSDQTGIRGTLDANCYPTKELMSLQNFEHRTMLSTHRSGLSVSAKP